MTKYDQDDIMRYLGTKCKVCGETITLDDLKSGVYGGYNSEQATHIQCKDNDTE